MKITIFFILNFINLTILLAYDPFLLQKDDHVKFNIKCTNMNEDLYKLNHKHVVILDYDLLKNDFPELQLKSNEQIQEIVLNNIGYIAKTQGDKGIIKRVNDKIHFDSQSVRIGAIRQFGFGRALDVPFFNGYINIKGIGAQIPVRREHKDGLMTLGEALREYTYSQITNMVLAHANINYSVVRSYGVIYPGFNVTWGNGTSDPAGFLLRRAYNRQEEYSFKNKDIEDLLSDYNIIMGSNIQNTEKGDIVDLGHVTMGHIQNKSEDETAPNFLEYSIGNFNELYGHDPQIKNSEQWGYSKSDYMWNRMHSLARQFQDDKNQANVYNIIEEYLNPIKDVLLSQNINQSKPIFVHKRTLSSPDLTHPSKLCGHLNQIFKSRKLKLNSKVLSGHTDWVISAYFSPDSSKVITISIGKTAIIWDAVSGNKISTFPTFEVITNSPIANHNQRMFFQFSNNNTITIFDSLTKNKISTLTGHRDWINSVNPSPDGSKFVTASNDKTAIIWDVATGEKIFVLTGHSAAVNSATFSPDGRKIITVSNDKTAIIWDIASHMNELYIPEPIFDDQIPHPPII